MKKVAYNSKYGGFGISYLAVDRLIELGHPKAQALKGLYITYDGKWTGQGGCHTDNPDCFIPRHDPLLIQVLEELGPKGDGECAKIRLLEMDDSDHYQISEFDGLEKVKILNLYCDCCK